MFKQSICITGTILLLAMICGCNKNAVVKSSPAAEESRKAVAGIVQTKDTKKEKQLRSRLIILDEFRRIGFAIFYNYLVSKPE